MTQTHTPAAAPRDAGGRFGPGNPGRPRGARNRASNRVLMSIFEDFEANKDQFLAAVRWAYPAQYFNTLVRLLPQQVEITAPDLENYSAAQAAVVLRQARAALDRIEAGDADLIELEAALIVEASPDGAAGGDGHRILR